MGLEATAARTSGCLDELGCLKGTRVIGLEASRVTALGRNEVTSLSIPSFFILYNNALYSMFRWAAAWVRFQCVASRTARIASDSACCVAFVTCSRIGSEIGRA